MKKSILVLILALPAFGLDWTYECNNALFGFDIAQLFIWQFNSG